MEKDAATSAGKPVCASEDFKKGHKVGKPRGQTCHWTPEPDEILRTAWSRGGLRPARRAIWQQQPTSSRSSIKRRAAALALTVPKARPWSAGRHPQAPHVDRQQRFPRSAYQTTESHRGCDSLQALGTRLCLGLPSRAPLIARAVPEDADERDI